MLCLLTDVKTRLGLVDATYDTQLTAMILATEGRFEHECGRKFARKIGETQIVRPDRHSFRVNRYPLEEITKWEVRRCGAWVEVTPAPDFVLRGGGVVLVPPWESGELGRVTYTGGYYTPDLPEPMPAGCEALPQDLRSASIEQIAAWYQWRLHVLERTTQDATGNIQVAGDQVWVPWVRDLLKRYRRVASLG